MTERIALPLRGRPLALLAAAALAACAGTVALGLAQLPVARAPLAHAHAAHRAGAMPFASELLLSRALGTHASSYAVRSSRTGALEARNSVQRLSARFTAAGVQIGSPGARLNMRLRAIGAPGSLLAVGGASPSARANTVRYERPGLSEWYANGPLGLEQGFTIARPPAGASGLSLTLALRVSGNVRAALDGRHVRFTGPHGAALSYGALEVNDARGRTLPSTLELRGGEVLLTADTRGARYPVTFDPLVQDGNETTNDESAEDSMLGYSVALSGDGTTAVVGGPTDGGGSGAVWVFVRAAGTWIQQGPKLVSEERPETAPACGRSKAKPNSARSGAASPSPATAARCWSARHAPAGHAAGKAANAASRARRACSCAPAARGRSRRSSAAAPKRPPKRASGAASPCPPTAPPRWSARPTTAAASAPRGCSPTPADRGASRVPS